MGLIWVLWICILIFISLITVYTASLTSLVLLFFCVVIPLIFILINRITKDNININFDFPTTFSKETTFQGKVNINLQTKSISRFTFIYVSIKNSLTLEETVQKIRFDMLKDKECIIKINSEFCGNLEINCNKIRIYDYFGLTYKTEKVLINSNIMIIPEIVNINNEIISENISNNSIIYSPYEIGNDVTEVFEYANYVIGDNVKLINWKLSSKYGKPIIKRGSSPIESTILIIFDNIISPSKDNTQIPNFLSSLAEKTISVLNNFLDNEICCTVCFYSCSEGDIIFLDINNEDDYIYTIHKILSAGFIAENESVYDRYKDFGNKYKHCFEINL